jgi:hypothetical protein
MHTIRLRGPWQLEPLERYVKRDRGGYQSDTIGLPANDRWKMPADWCETMGPDFLGVVRYRRTFHRPSKLTSTAKVWLVVEPPRSYGLVRLGGRPLGEVEFGGPPSRFDITAHLGDRNFLEIDVAHPVLDDDWLPTDDGSVSQTGGLIGEVRLEIEE